MSFLLDQNADRRFAPYLRSLGHDVTVVAIDYPPGLPDEEVLAIAHREGRTILTNDTDFGELAIRRGLPHVGIILFRVKAATFAVSRDRLDFVLTNYRDHLDQLLVVTLRGVRVRRASPPSTPA